MERWFKIAGTFSLIVILSAVIAGCKETEVHGPVDANGAAPPPVRNTAVQNLPGGAKNSYELPAGKTLLYVLAKYELRPGVGREAKSSDYINALEVNGFCSSGTYQVELYSVGRSENMSEPVIAT